MNTPYPLLPIGILVLMLYLLSGLLVRLYIISQVLHRKIWNSLLLITFLVTGILGILQTVQINYKLEWPVTKTILLWHVDFGIALGCIRTFHFLWNRKYYFKIFNSDEGSNSIREMVQDDPQYQNVTHLRLLILLSGFLSTTIQVLLIREIATIFQGNELMMSWTAGCMDVVDRCWYVAGKIKNKTGKNCQYPRQDADFIGFLAGNLSSGP